MVNIKATPVSASFTSQTNTKSHEKQSGPEGGYLNECLSLSFGKIPGLTLSLLPFLPHLETAKVTKVRRWKIHNDMLTERYFYNDDV